MWEPERWVADSSCILEKFRHTEKSSWISIRLYSQNHQLLLKIGSFFFKYPTNLSSTAKLYAGILPEWMSWLWESYRLSPAVGPSSLFLSSRWPASKKQYYWLPCERLMLSWTCSCTVFWHYVKLSCTIRHLNLLYFACTCCQPVFFAKYGVLPKINCCLCFEFRTLTSVIFSSP